MLNDVTSLSRIVDVLHCSRNQYFREIVVTVFVRFDCHREQLARDRECSALAIPGLARSPLRGAYNTLGIRNQSRSKNWVISTALPRVGGSHLGHHGSQGPSPTAPAFVQGIITRSVAPYTREPLRPDGQRARTGFKYPSGILDRSFYRSSQGDRDRAVGVTVQPPCSQSA